MRLGVSLSLYGVFVRLSPSLFVELPSYIESSYYVSVYSTPPVLELVSRFCSIKFSYTVLACGQLADPFEDEQ